MRHSGAEKLETIRLVEDSELSVTATLRELGVPRRTFDGWYRRYKRPGSGGFVGSAFRARLFLEPDPPDPVRKQVVETALEHPEASPRELAWQITDTQGYFISESSVYRILKRCDLITSPAYIVMSASDHFSHPTHRVNELWQTDFTYFRVVGWGWYYLSTVLDDYSRYIIGWKLFQTMAASDVQETLDLALEATGVRQVQVRHRPRLLSDNGPCYVSHDLKEVSSATRDGTHARGALSPDDSGEDRALPSFDEKRGQTGTLLLSVGTGAGDRAMGCTLQPPSLSRIAEQRHTGGCLLWPSAGNPLP